MKLTDKEEKIARLALDAAAKDGERAAAALKLIESLHARGVSVEDITKEEVHTEYIFTDPPPPPRPRYQDAPWDPDPEVRRRNYEATDAAGYQWDQQYGYGYQYSPPPEPTPEEKATREEANRKYRAEYERKEREEAARIREAQARERARQAVLAARPGYVKFASALGKVLGPYSKGGAFHNHTGNPDLEEKINTSFGLVLLALIALLPVGGIVALFFSYPVVGLVGLVVLFLIFNIYLRNQAD